ncbi:MAG: arginine decarboxylase, partial [Coleofasciculaceae cyanobacterium]
MGFTTSTVGNSLDTASDNPEQTQPQTSHVPTVTDPNQPAWKIEDSEKLYRIQGWGEPYFSINAAGHVTVSPKGDRGGSLDLFELVESLQ